MSRKTTIVIIILLALSFLFGIFAGLQIGLGNKKVSGISGQADANTFQAGWEAAKKRLNESGFSPMMSNLEIKSLSGEVKTIKDGKLIIKVRPLEPLTDPKLDERTVTVGSNTKIYQLIQKDQQEIQAEMEAFQKSMRTQVENPTATASSPVMPPEMYAKKEIALSEITIGQQITVTAGENIADSREFKAVEITVQPLPVMPAPEAPITAPTPTVNQ